MKHIFTLALLLAAYASQATILNLNNSATSPGQYTTAAAAITAASTGDTILIAGTDLSYGSFTINKSISLIGPGWIINGAGISKVAICADITVSVHDVKIEGIRCNTITAASGGSQINNLRVKRCIFDSGIGGSSEHVVDGLIEGCIFTEWNDYNISSSTSSWNFDNCTITNNIFSGYLYNVDNSVIQNNIFLGTSTLTNLSATYTNNNVFQGNIAIGRSLGSLPATNTVSGNLGYSSGGTVWGGSGNINEADPTFTTYTPLALHTWNNDYSLLPGSPAIALGPGGEDAGVFGGDGVYRQDGEPSVPIIRAVAVPGGNTVPANSTFTINITTVSHE
ncbi:MAG: hypothetical protein JNM00_00570 [Flavobacteriales bacterium]|nr:hypothetical protein [Flavobacteriales bacterium]